MSDKQERMKLTINLKSVVRNLQKIVCHNFEQFIKLFVLIANSL